MANVSGIIASALQIPANTFEGQSARKIVASLERKLAKRVADQRSIDLSINLLEQLIKATSESTADA